MEGAKEGATVELQATARDFTEAVTVPILTIESGEHVGQFTPFSASLFLVEELTQFPDEIPAGAKACEPACAAKNTVYLTIGDNGEPFSEFAETRNQKAVARGLDAAREATIEAGTSDLADVFFQLRAVKTAQELGAALDAIGGESLTQFLTTRLAISSRVQRSIHRRVRDLGERPSDPRSGDSAGTPAAVGNAEKLFGRGPQQSASKWRTAMALGMPAGAVSAPARTPEAKPWQEPPPWRPSTSPGGPRLPPEVWAWMQKFRG